MTLSRRNLVFDKERNGVSLKARGHRPLVAPWVFERIQDEMMEPREYLDFIQRLVMAVQRKI